MSSWFSLPLTSPDPTQTPDEASSSDPDWLLNQNFKDRLHFEAWSGFEQEVTAVRRDLSRLKSTSKARKEIQSHLRPVRKDLEEEAWHDCWNESAVERLVAVQVWRATSHARNAVLSIRSDTVSDFCCFAKASDSKNGKSPLATVELKGSQAKLIHVHEDGSSSQKVADYCQSVFAKRPVKNVLGEYFHVAKRLSQALTQAFHTESGCGALYNHVYGLFFYIEGKKEVETRKVRVVVKISRVYRCDEFPSNLHAFTAWIFLAEKLAVLGDDEKVRKRKQQLLDAIEFVSTSSREHEDDDDSPPSSSSEDPTSPPGTPSSGTASPDRKKQRRNTSQKKSNKKSGSSSNSKKRPSDIIDSDPPISRATALSKRRWEGFEAFLAKSGLVDANLLVESCRDDELIRHALDCDIEILGEGAFGIVRRALVNGREAALKYHNRCVGGAQQCLHNEMLIYCRIASRFPHLLNYSVPNLIAVGFDEWAGPVLITEVGGEDVDLADGCLTIGNEQLHLEVSFMVCEAAMDRLNALHQCGILHRDVTLRNLRARIHGKDIHNDDLPRRLERCVTWWIDLGFSKFGGCRDEFDFEMEQCKSRGGHFASPGLSFLPTDIKIMHSEHYFRASRYLCNAPRYYW